MKIFHRLSLIALAAAAILPLKAKAADHLASIRDTITDLSIVYPESFEADTHQLMRNWYLTNYAVLDYDTDTSADVPATDEQLIERLLAMPTVIEMPFNSIVKSYIELYTARRRQLVESFLGMSIYYMPIFEEALEREGLPLELKYLPIIESALNPNAVSRAGAAGLWQFMPPTAKGLGLEINSLVDERRDPIRSSEMAARYLHQLYDIFHDWSLAIAAYNCGPGNINKALRRAGEMEGKKDFWAIYPYLPAETKGYFPGFIAATYTMTHYDKHNISPALARRPIVTDSVRVNKRVYFEQIADVLNIPIDEIRILNPQYRKDVIPGDVKPYSLVLPSHQVLSYIISEDSIVSHNAHLYARRDIVEPNDGSKRISEDGKYDIVEETKYHKVRKGETFSSIAKRYGVTVNSIKRVNGIKKLHAGRTLKIVTTKRIPRPVEPIDTTAIQVPVPETIEQAEGAVVELEGPTPETEVAAATEEDATAAQTAANETEEELAEEVAEELDGEIATDETAGANDIEEDEIETIVLPASKPEQKAETEKMAEPEPQKTDVKPAEAKKAESKPQPKQEPAKKAEPKPVYHKVTSGQNLSKIAKRYGTTVKKIEALNPGIDPSKLKIGQRIRVK